MAINESQFFNQSQVANKFSNIDVTQQNIENTIDPKKQLENTIKEIKRYNLLLVQQKKQLCELEQKRQQILDSKYHYEQSQEIKQLQEIIIRLKQYCQVNREKQKQYQKQQSEVSIRTQEQQKPESFKFQQKKELIQQQQQNQSSQQNQKKKDVKQQQLEQISPSSIKVPVQQQSKNIQQPIQPVKVIIEQKMINLMDTELLIQQNRQLCEELDIYNQRNSRLQGKNETQQKLIKNLTQKSNKVDQKYEELKQFVRANQISEQPGAEQKYKKLILKSVALEKQIAVNKNMFEIQISDQKKRNEDIIKLCQDRTNTCKKYEENIMEVRKQIEEMKQIQQTLKITLNHPLDHKIQMNTRVLSYNSPLLLKENNSQILDILQNQTINNESFINKNEDKLSQPTEHQEEQKDQDEAFKETMENNRRLELIQSLFETFNEDQFITTVDQAQKVLTESFNQVLFKEFQPSEEQALQWLNNYGTDNKLNRQQFELFLTQQIDDYAETIQ